MKTFRMVSSAATAHYRLQPGSRSAPAIRSEMRLAAARRSLLQQHRADHAVMIGFAKSSYYCGSRTVAGLPISPSPTTRTFAGSALLALRDTA
jgi:hypothetical protein